MSQDIIIGRNAVREALRAGRSINKIMLASENKSGPVKEIIDLARENKVPVQNVDRKQLDKLAGGRHQGVVAVAAAKDYADLDDMLEAAEKQGPPFLILLDEINDPHNLGAIIRTADAAGVHGVIIPRRRSVQLTAAVAKASAGAVEHVPVARVTNLSQTIKKLQRRGIWVVGADMDGQQLHWDAPLDGPVALVIGGEGKGLGRLVKENCDMVVKLPMRGRINSLNASVAAALLAYEVVRQRTKGADNA
ncbi:23S rRNA (guanosine2251-2'-O)-methyltransferase [Desulfohalotomaculum tongense]|uniref:23S rRNA (guanosine(2251)-2'-O)-methyltransferase RlmB n=1 Tax=Desulforadius tongensis TaxID=1216062 RepID=UPI00195BFA0C|nr:23S rRNA (guanosine(2251)-2'-O)-methyltransferase RlmB [Desulforadius tongensis]MBM7853807.1 23S rRNA (guanosine2251-2'-O)-methyltransferase [Desulforadius tongensis]